MREYEISLTRILPYKEKTAEVWSASYTSYFGPFWINGQY